MVKRMIHGKEGVVTKLVQERQLTLTELAAKTGIDRKTLRLIDKGQPVRGITLHRFAQKLGIPISHVQQGDLPGENIGIDDPGQVLLKKIDATGLKDLLKSSFSIKWKLELSIIDDVKERALRTLESQIDTARELLNRPFSFNDSHFGQVGTLSFQMNALKVWNKIDESIVLLSNNGVYIMAGTYLYWERGTKESEIHYRSTKNTIVGVVEQSVQSIRVAVDVGYVPPAELSELADGECAVFINKRLAWTNINGFEDPGYSSMTASKYELLFDDIPF